METKNFNLNEQLAKCEAYLSRALQSPVRLIHAEQLTQSTRAAPWRLEVEVNGVRRRYVLRLDARRSGHEYTVLRAMETVPIPTPSGLRPGPGGRSTGRAVFPV